MNIQVISKYMSLGGLDFDKNGQIGCLFVDFSKNRDHQGTYILKLPVKVRCRNGARQKVYDEITDEIAEILEREDHDEGEDIRLNGKYVWEAARKVCNFINAHEDLIKITTFSEYRNVMKRVMRVIKEAHNIEQKKGDKHRGR